MTHHLITYHLFLLKNISKNLTSMPYQLIPRHLFVLKNNSKNLRKLPHSTPSVCMDARCLQNGNKKKKHLGNRDTTRTMLAPEDLTGIFFILSVTSCCYYAGVNGTV
jgi:hypothetical protein